MMFHRDRCADHRARAHACLRLDRRGGPAQGAHQIQRVAQAAMMPMFVRQPRKRAPLYNATGTSCYVAGMLVSAFAMRALLLGNP